VADLLQGYLQSGKHHEATGDLVAALRHFKLALTVDPSNQVALRSCNRLEKEIRSSAEKHYNAGLNLQKEGKYALARKEFLTALRLYPGYQKASEMLTAKKRIEIKGYVAHKVKPGDNLSKLAAIYYGDYRKFPIIAKYNNISDAIPLRVGQELKIPEIRSIEFAEGKRPTEDNDMALKEDEVDQATIYRDHGIELFNDKKYQKALIEFNKVLSANPDDSVVLEYAYKCCFLQAVDFYEQKDYLTARDRFRLSLKYRSDCQQCHKYMKNCENSYKKLHYKKGMQFYNNERINEAIKEWKLVRNQDPDYKRVNYLINKAQTILKKLNELKNNEKGE